MNKKFISFFLALLLCFTLVCNASLNVYASSVDFSSIATWEEALSNFKSMSTSERMGAIFTMLSAYTGIVPTNKTVASAVRDYWISQITDSTTNFSSQSESEQNGTLEKVLSKLEEQGTKPNNNKITVSASTKKEFKNCFNTYVQNKETPLYYTVHVPSIDQLYPANVYRSYIYYQIKQAVDEFDCVSFYIDSSLDSLYILPCDFSSNEYFYLGSKLNISYNGTKGYYFSANPYKISTESSVSSYRYRIDFDDDKSIITDIASNYSSFDTSISYSLCDNALDFYSCLSSFSTLSLPTGRYYTVAKEDKYIKAYTSFANYQNSLANKVTRNYYYSTAYYNTTYEDTDVDLETLYKYMDNITSIISTLQKEEKENNYDEDALTRRLDALINAVWSSTGDISDDTGTIVEQNKKYYEESLKWYEKIYDKICDVKDSILDTTVSEPWNKQVTDLVKNTDNDTAMNNFFTSLSVSFTPVGDAMKTKFPFSMPWDVYAVIALLCAEPQTPKYTLPFKFETFGIDTELVVDCSHLSFLATVSRVMLTLLYILGLIKLTSKLVSKGDD